MKVLITNDDGVHAQGIIELAKRVRQHAEVFVVAPQVEQSGVSQAITFLEPLFAKSLGGDWDSQDDQIPGFSVNGTPVDCVKLGVNELAPWKPDLVLSGINGGLNCGVNVCYSGTVGGALAASTYGIPAIAISLESAESMNFARAAELAWPMIERFQNLKLPTRTALNINFPTASLDGNAETKFVPVETNPMGFHFDKGIDPKGRNYFWATNNPPPQPSGHETDTQSLLAGHVTVSAISYDLNQPVALAELADAERNILDDQV
ncbi:MAG: 5'/3'-nucleotidase SurE [Mariniblastus sp.]